MENMQFNWADTLEQPTPQTSNEPTWEDTTPLENMPNDSQPNPTEYLSDKGEPLPEGFKIVDNSLEPSIPKNYSYLGASSRIEVSNNAYQFNADNFKAIEDLNQIELKPLDNDGRFDFNPQPNTELAKIIESIVRIGISKGQKITNCFIYKNKPNESSLNIFKGKPSNSFIYFLQGTYNSGDLVFDLSSIGGPSVKAIDSCPGILSIFPGWVPYSISKNMSDQDLIVIAGTLG